MAGLSTEPADAAAAAADPASPTYDATATRTGTSKLVAASPG